MASDNDKKLVFTSIKRKIMISEECLSSSKRKNLPKSSSSKNKNLSFTLNMKNNNLQVDNRMLCMHS